MRVDEARDDRAVVMVVALVCLELRRRADGHDTVARDRDPALLDRARVDGSTQSAAVDLPSPVAQALLRAACRLRPAAPRVPPLPRPRPVPPSASRRSRRARSRLRRGRGAGPPGTSSSPGRRPGSAAARATQITIPMRRLRRSLSALSTPIRTSPSRSTGSSKRTPVTIEVIPTKRVVVARAQLDVVLIRVEADEERRRRGKHDEVREEDAADEEEGGRENAAARRLSDPSPRTRAPGTTRAGRR